MIEIKDILAMKEERRAYFSALHANMDEAETYYNLAFEISTLQVPEGVDQVIPSTARVVIDRATDHVASNWVIVKAESKGRAKDARVQADKLERVGQAFFYEANMEGDSLPIHAAVKSGLEFGMYVIRIVWDEKIWEEYEGEHFPFHIDVLDPRTVFPEPGRLREPRNVIEFCERERGDLAAHFTDWEKGKVGNPNDRVEWLSYWDKDNYLYAIDGEVVYQDKNPYGFCPYTVGISGLGEPFEGMPPEKRMRSILWPIRKNLDFQARLMTDMGAIIRWGAWQFPTYRRGDDVKGIDFTMAPGRLQEVPLSFKLEELMQFNPQLLTLLQINDAQIEAAIGPGLISTGAFSSGYERAVAMRDRDQRFAYLLSQLNYSLTWLYRSALRVIDTHPDKPPISISGMVRGKRGKQIYAQETISHDDIKGTYSNVTCQLEQADPLANQAKAMLGSNLHTAGKISLRTFLEDYAGIEDYTSEIAQIMAERVLFSPAIQQLIEQSIVQEAGFAEFVQQEAQGVGETLGVPAEGGMPAPGEGAPVFSETETMFGPGAPTPQQDRLQEIGVMPPRAPGPRFEKISGS